MSAPTGHIELERAVDAISVGNRHRTELGDLDALAASIDRDGLLQPPTITPDGVLVCGARRLAAIKKLGWRKVSVWVRSGISDRLGHLLAEQDDNALHKPLTPIESAALYRELKTLMAEDAARRQEASRFGPDRQPGMDGGAESAPPSQTVGKTRAQAAQMVTGTSSYTRLEQIGYLQRLAEDPAVSDVLRAQAREGLDQIGAGAAVNPIYQRLRDDHTRATIDRDAHLHELAEQALARAHDTKTGKTKKKATPRRPGTEDESTRFPVRAFVLTWGELECWWLHYDVDELAAGLTDEQAEAFFDTAEGTSRFADQLRTARVSACESDRPRLRAL